MEEKQFLKFFTEYYGEPVDSLKQIGLASFNGEELFEFVNDAISQHMEDCRKGQKEAPKNSENLNQTPV